MYIHIFDKRKYKAASTHLFALWKFNKNVY